MALENVTDNFGCEVYDNNKLFSWDQDSLIFQDDNGYWWNNVVRAKAFDFNLLVDILNSNSKTVTHCLVLKCSASLVVDLLQVAAVSRGLDAGAASLEARQTVDYFWAYGEKRNSFTKESLSQTAYLLSDTIQFAIGNNNFEFDESPICSTFVAYPNNVEYIDMSDTPMGYLSCPGLFGLLHLNNFKCTRCKIRGWQRNFYANYPIKTLELTGNELGPFLRENTNGSALSGISDVQSLYLGEQMHGGIQYLKDLKLFSVLPNLTHLDLHSNSISVWTISTAENLKLRYLNLRDNRIAYINGQIRDELNSQYILTGLQVDLVGNDATCSEAHSDYIQWLLTSPSVLHGSRIKCAGSDLSVTEYLQQLSATTSSAPRLATTTISLVNSVSPSPTPSASTTTRTTMSTDVDTLDTIKTVPPTSENNAKNTTTMLSTDANKVGNTSASTTLLVRFQTTSPTKLEFSTNTNSAFPNTFMDNVTESFTRSKTPSTSQMTLSIATPTIIILTIIALAVIGCKKRRILAHYCPRFQLMPRNNRETNELVLPLNYLSDSSVYESIPDLPDSNATLNVPMSEWPEHHYFEVLPSAENVV